MSKLFNDYFEVTVNRPHGGRPSFEINLCGFAISSDDIMAGNGQDALAAQLGKISAALRAGEDLLGKPLSMDSLTALESALMAIGGSEEDHEGIDLSMIDSAVAIAENMESREAKKVQAEMESMKTKQENKSQIESVEFEGRKVKMYPRPDFDQIDEQVQKRDEAEFNESQQAQKTRAVLEVVADVISDKEETINGVLVPLSVIIELEDRYKKLKKPEKVKEAEAKIELIRDRIVDILQFMAKNPLEESSCQWQLAGFNKDLAIALDELADLKAQ